MDTEQIEHRAERMMDALDKRYLSGELDKDEYEEGVEVISSWIKAKVTSYWIAANPDMNLEKSE